MGSPAIDLFSGSGVVAARLGRGRAVTAVDVQEYSRILSSAQLAPARVSQGRLSDLINRADAVEAGWLAGPLGQLVEAEKEATSVRRDSLSLENLAGIIEHGSIQASHISHEIPEPIAREFVGVRDGDAGLNEGLTLTRYYGGVFFSYAQALKLDCLIQIARQEGTDTERDTLLAALLGAASDCVTSTGNHFAQPLRPIGKTGEVKYGTLSKVQKQRTRSPLVVFEERINRYRSLSAAKRGSLAVKQDFREFFERGENDFGVVYADPPYTRDHYSRFYHVLETIALGDDPGISLSTSSGDSVPSRGLYRERRHQSPFSVKTQVELAFQDLFESVSARGVPLIVSYSGYDQGTVARPKPRLLTLQELSDIAGQYFCSIDIRSAGQVAHSRFNAKHLNIAPTEEAESFIVALP